MIERITLTDVNVSYGDNNPNIIHNLNLEVGSGQVITIAETGSW